MLTIIGGVHQYAWYQKYWASKCAFIDKDKKQCQMRKRKDSVFCKKHFNTNQDESRTALLCKYHLPVKDRRCRLQAQQGSEYCAEHAVHDTSGEGERIPCPLDKKHTVAVAELEEHLAKKCNRRIRTEYPWIRENFNCVEGETKFTDKIDYKPEMDDIERVMARIPEIYASFSDHIRQSFQKTPAVEEELAKPVSDKARKHLEQINSIIGNLQYNDFVHNDKKNAVIDFGGGRGELVYYLGKTYPKAGSMIVERSGVKNKYENRLKKEQDEVNVSRLRCSIEHLDLSAVPYLADRTSISVVCKHFCGSAFDGALRCIEHALGDRMPIDGLFMVPCCVHKCPWAEYSGHNFIESNGLQSVQDFAALRHIASWANCGFDHEKGETEEDVELSETDALKMELGKKAKMILHWGRAESLRAVGYEVDLVEFCPSTVTPENVALLGRHS